MVRTRPLLLALAIGLTSSAAFAAGEMNSTDHKAPASNAEIQKSKTPGNGTSVNNPGGTRDNDSSDTSSAGAADGSTGGSSSTGEATGSGAGVTGGAAEDQDSK
ncbi:hypothetical protein ACE1YR_15080 [Pseudomonas sp. K1(2024)]|uniref:Uncharacterized protein n=2 Tax=Pseudomonas TaxID=286 RepID=A0AAI8PBJ7_9PSED|nr:MULTISPECIES: hypothetical protein [Pseudomonas]AIZ32895.1 hypothetical protein NJ69_07735 [Pseudomonas parafulva]AXO88486.1 hypothetical protein DZC75_10945 [Pseudomonas parafulva]MDO7903682.1 hypothetical protein [Pseudomonas sp. K13]MDV9031754.1 hypothetical protein [Pseudomonas sp. RAC1]